MRLAAFVFSVIVLAAGLLLGVVYPKTMENRLGREIGRWTVYAGGDDFLAPEATLSPSDGATVMNVAIRTSAPLRAREEREFLVLSVLDGAGTEIYRGLLDVPEQGALESPQTGVLLYRRPAGTLEPAAGRHTFVLEAGRDFEDTVLTIELVLNAESYNVQPEAGPVGIGLMVVGGIGLLLSLRRRHRNPNSSPPQKWGRRQ